MVKATARVEGNHPTAAIVLLDYHRVIDSLLKLSASSPYPSIKQIITAMVRRLRKYESEALRCDATVVATVFNPRLRLKFFELHHPSHVPRITKMLQDHFQPYLDRHLSTQTSQPDARTPSKTSTEDDYDVFKTAGSSADIGVNDELEGYLGGKFPARGEGLLAWWKVRSFFPVFSLDSHDLYTFLC